jgi:hypothetical protein
VKTSAIAPNGGSTPNSNKSGQSHSAPEGLASGSFSRPYFVTALYHYDLT